MVSTVAPSCIGLGLKLLRPVDRVSVRTEESVIRPRKLSWQYLELVMITVLHSFRIRLAHLSCSSTVHKMCIWKYGVKIIKESLRFSIPWSVTGSEVCTGWIPIDCFMNPSHSSQLHGQQIFERDLWVCVNDIRFEGQGRSSLCAVLTCIGCRTSRTSLRDAIMRWCTNNVLEHTALAFDSNKFRKFSSPASPVTDENAQSLSSLWTDVLCPVHTQVSHTLSSHTCLMRCHHIGVSNIVQSHVSRALDTHRCLKHYPITRVSCAVHT